jgi:pyruvate/2-oxoglutarate dehydrogenase complex dihydrolipoamide dehydrogenase (E3) component
VRNILVPIHNTTVRKKSLPSVIYTHSEIARVGKTKQELLKYMNSEDIVTKSKNFEENDRSKVTNNTH